MKTAFLLIIMIFFFSGNVQAGDIYVCIDSKGNKVMTTTPEDGMKDCMLKESYDELSEKELNKIKQERASASSNLERRDKQKEKKDEVSCRKEIVADRMLGMPYNQHICVFKTICVNSDGRVVKNETSTWLPCN